MAKTSELMVVNLDPTGKRVTVQCSACGRVFTIGADALATAVCGCRPMSTEQWKARQSEKRDRERQWEQKNNWRPGR
jgi:hypothetical protein